MRKNPRKTFSTLETVSSSLDLPFIQLKLSVVPPEKKKKPLHVKFTHNTHTHTHTQPLLREWYFYSSGLFYFCKMNSNSREIKEKIKNPIHRTLLLTLFFSLKERYDQKKKKQKEKPSWKDEKEEVCLWDCFDALPFLFRLKFERLNDEINSFRQDRLSSWQI